jgi:lipoate-protein ligase A
VSGVRIREKQQKVHYPTPPLPHLRRRSPLCSTPSPIPLPSPQNPPSRARELIHVEETVRRPEVAVIRRYSGGGTVVVDRDTLFTSLILNAPSLPRAAPADPPLECFPAPIMRWTEHFFRPVFAPYGPFALRENDYVFGGKKVGGNAQAISRQRFVHHTSFLWDYDPARMALLKNPKKQPDYRQKRDHNEFLTRLRDMCGGGGGGGDPRARAALVDRLHG